MDFAFSEEEQRFRQDVRRFFMEEKKVAIKAKDEWHSGQGFGPNVWDILHKLGERGWLCPTWPKQYGGLEFPYIYRYIIMEEMESYTGIFNTVAVGMAGPVILAHGSPDQKKEYLPRIAKGQIEFALGYTEPEAGSDLASLNMKAVDSGDFFLVNGGKMFNTRCHYAQYHWLAARTRQTEKKHQGISLFIVDLKTPGITINPLWTVGGVRTNEVFYDNVKVSKDCLVGEVDHGFYYIIEALNYERVIPSSGLQQHFEQLIDYVKTIDKRKDSCVHQKLAELAIDVECVKLLSLKVAWMLNNKKVPSHETAMLKILRAETEQRLADTALQIFGPFGQLSKGTRWAPLDGLFEWRYRDSLEFLIAGGTSEILRNLIAQRGLDLPRR